MTETTSSQSGSQDLAREIDDVVSDDLLVVGSPPGGRDLDVMARAENRAKLAAWLESSGFVNHQDQWVRFGACSAEAIDLLSPAAFGLDDATTADLFRDAHPLPGFRHLARPAPHHLLLMLARWTAEGDGSLADKRRARIAQALNEDAEAWSTAASQASAWRATSSLAALRRVYTTGAGLTRAERAAALAESVYAAGRTPWRARLRAWIAALRPRRRKGGFLVSFSGLDGAGKSSQVEALRRSLERLGFDVEVQWTRLEWTTLWENPWLGVLGWPARTALRLVSRLRSRGEASEAEGGTARTLEPSAVRERSALISQVWVAIVALAHATAQRRETRQHLRGGKVVLCDRYTLDTAVHLRFRYGEQRNYRFQIGLVDRLSPRPIAVYLLDVPAATAYARKAEQYSLEDLERQASLYLQESARLGVRRLDGELPREQLCADIATEVWRALRSV